MPESRKRPGHQFQKPSDIPAKQRTKAPIIFGLLFAVFTALIVYFSGARYRYVILAAIIGAGIGFFFGKASERAAKNKQINK